MKRVWGDGGGFVDALIVRTMRNFEDEDWKDWRAEVNSGRMLRSELLGTAIVSGFIVGMCCREGDGIIVLEKAVGTERNSMIFGP